MGMINPRGDPRSQSLLLIGSVALLLLMSSHPLYVPRESMNGKLPTLLSVLFTCDVKQETDDYHVRPLA